MALNHTEIQGRLVDNPVCGQTNSGADYANFRIAWNEKYKDKETKLFIECKSFNGTAQFVQRYFTKGQEIIVEGKLNTEEWENNGQKRSKTVLIVSNVHFSGKKQDNPSQESVSQSVPTPVETDELPF